MRGAIIGVVLFVAGWHAHAQISPTRIALSRVEKGKWGKAEKTLKRVLRKDSLHAEAHYVYALWFFSSSNPSFHIDSAYHHAQMALADYTNAGQRQQEKMSRFPLDSTHILQLRGQIEGQAFENTKHANTEAAYIAFLNRFPFAAQRAMAIELRDEIAFLEALKINTYQSFQEYLSKYPQSGRAEEAGKRYEKLLFQEKTRDGKLNSYVLFYKQYPNSPYQAEVLQNIFEIATAPGNLASYLGFLKAYPGSPYEKRARDLAYHLALEGGAGIPNAIMGDSVRHAQVLAQGYWVPFMKNGKFGFMDEQGGEVMAPDLKSIDEDYICGNVTTDYLVTSRGVIGRTGGLLSGGDVTAVDEIGSGFLLVGSECNRVVHKSGFAVADCVEDAREIARHFLALRKDKKWQLMAFNGRPLLEQPYDDIRSEEDIILLTRNGKTMLNTVEEVGGVADKNPLPDDFVFDEVRKLNSQFLWVKNGVLEGVLDYALQWIVPLDRQVLTLTPFGFTKKTQDKVATLGVSKAIDGEGFNDIQPYGDWLGLYRTGRIQLYSRSTARIVGNNLDSLWFSKGLALAKKRDSLHIFFGTSKRMQFPIKTKIAFVKSPDSVRFFYLEEKNKKQLFAVDTGNKLFAMEFDAVEEVGFDLFLITHNEKKGLAGANGKWVLPPEYDAIVKSTEGRMSLLKDKKFGLFDLQYKKLIKPAYERNIQHLGGPVLVAFRDGFYGFISLDERPLSGFEFDEVKPWNDSTAWVKKDFRWMLYEVYSQKVQLDQIKDYLLLADTGEEKIARIHKENHYGILSSTRDVVIPPTYNEIINLGTAEKPFYFTEKHVEEADIFVVIYYDKDGRQVRREIYEADEYDRIYCRNNQ